MIAAKQQEGSPIFNSLYTCPSPPMAGIFINLCVYNYMLGVSWVVSGLRGVPAIKVRGEWRLGG